MYYIVSNLEYLLKNNVNVSLFFHVAPNYYKLKKKKTFLNYIKKLQKNIT